MENIIIEKDGLEFQITTSEMELEIDKYTNAWKIIKQNPKNYKEFLDATMYARASTSQIRLGCNYSDLSEKINQLFN